MVILSIPDVIGFTLREAREMLAGAGIDVSDVEIEITAPPRRRGTGWHDNCRVVRIKAEDNGKMALIVCDPYTEGYNAVF